MYLYLAWLRLRLANAKISKVGYGGRVLAIFIPFHRVFGGEGGGEKKRRKGKEK